MRKVFLFLFTTMFILSSCGFRYEYEPVFDDPDFRIVVQKGFMLETKYGMERLDEDEWDQFVYPEYDKIKIHGHLIEAKSESCHDLFLRDGLMFCLDDDDLSFEYLGNGFNYGKNIFAEGEYVLLKGKEDKTALFFVDEMTKYGWVDFVTFGPYKEFFPGCGGYIYQDLFSDKWGVYACRWIKTKDGFCLSFKINQEVALPEFDRVVEVCNLKQKKSVWLVKKDGLWTGLNSEGSVVNITSKQLSKVLMMPVSKQFDEKKQEQRIGTETASVAFVNFNL